MRTASWNDVQARIVSGRDFCLEPLGVPELSGAMLVNAAAEAGFRFVSIFAHAPTPEMQIDEVVADVVNNAVRMDSRDEQVADIDASFWHALLAVI